MLSLSDEILRIVGLLLMIVDHTSIYLSSDIGRIIGRLTAPIYFYLLVKGSERTLNQNRYSGRLLFWAFISQLTIFVCQVPLHKFNILFTLYYCSFMLRHKHKWQWLGLYSVVAQLFNLSYGWYGVICCYLLHLYRKSEPQKIFGANTLFWLSWLLLHILVGIFYSYSQSFAVLSIFIIYIFESNSHKLTFKIPKIFWYSSYPLQWIILSQIFKLV